MKLIKSLADIDYSSANSIAFEGTVIGVLSEGDGDKRPFKFSIKLEESGELLNANSWKFDNLQTIKDLVKSSDVYRFEAVANTFGNYGQQIRVGNIQPTGKKSTKKIVKDHDADTLRRDISVLVNTYVKTDILKIILNKLIFDNDDFFKWPAATRIHHNYPGGLATHSLAVAKNAIATWKNYNGDHLDIEVIVTAALLHDIGKLDEYKIDGSRTVYGDLIPHPVSGAERVAYVAMNNGADPNKNMKVLMVRHIILSHHEKLEFGAAVKPLISEAWIVANADKLDAEMESINTALDNLTMNTESDRLMALDSGKILKWN